MANNRWMSDLPTAITRAPLSCLAIPGSHNSGTHDLDPALGVAMDQSAGVRLVGNSICGSRVVHRWSKTQHLSIADQLEAGVRYLDLRVAVHPQTKEFRFVHGLYGGLVSHVLRDINTFLTYNPQEVLILDFNHFYNMSPAHHEMLLSEIMTRFGHTIVPPPFSRHAFSTWSMTLQSLWTTPYRVIPIYHDHKADIYPRIWSNMNIESPWPNLNNVQALIASLDDKYYNKHRSHNDIFYNWQAILTPKKKDIALNLGTSLEERMANRATEAFVKWLQTGKSPGPQGINICTVDFVEKHNFIPTVISLNNIITMSTH